MSIQFLDKSLHPVIKVSYYVENISFIVRKMLYLCRSIGVVGLFQKTVVFQSVFLKSNKIINSHCSFLRL